MVFPRTCRHRLRAIHLHNVDVLSTIDLRASCNSTRIPVSLVTVQCRKRESSRQLLFDDNDQLCGRRAGGDRDPKLSSVAPHLEPLAFSGIHVISPRLLKLMTEKGSSPSSTAICGLLRREKRFAFHADEYYWRDLGKPDSIRQAAHDLAVKVFLQ